MSDAEVICGWMEPMPLESPGAYCERIHADGGNHTWPDWWEESEEYGGEWQPTTIALNECHEVEAQLTEEQWNEYQSMLDAYCLSWPFGKLNWWAIHATAEQKVKALAAVIRAMEGPTMASERLSNEIVKQWASSTSPDATCRALAREVLELRRDKSELVAAISVLTTPPDKNEATAYPWWAIVRKGSFGRYIMLVGPFFSREEAEAQRKRRIYDYGEKSFVFCYSGHESSQYVELRKRAAIDAAREGEHGDL